MKPAMHRITASSGSERNRLRRAAAKTRLGQVIVLWSLGDEVSVKRIYLPNEVSQFRSYLSSIPLEICPQIDYLVQSIERFFVGKAVSFDIEVLDLSSCGVFQRSVLIQESKVPRGKVTTYGSIAACLGNAGAARAVGTALRNNPFPVAIPCHRTVMSDGSLGGFRGAVVMKRALLEMEGIEIDDRGRIPLDSFLHEW